MPKRHGLLCQNGMAPVVAQDGPSANAFFFLAYHHYLGGGITLTTLSVVNLTTLSHFPQYK